MNITGFIEISCMLYNGTCRATGTISVVSPKDVGRHYWWFHQSMLGGTLREQRRPATDTFSV